MDYLFTIAWLDAGWYTHVPIPSVTVSSVQIDITIKSSVCSSHPFGGPEKKKGGGRKKQWRAPTQIRRYLKGGSKVEIALGICPVTVYTIIGLTTYCILTFEPLQGLSLLRWGSQLRVPFLNEFI